MGRNSQPRKRFNVKSGCVTCKARKVKCDEGRPACQRCVSTGRVCDGYGIWGSGGNRYDQRQRQAPQAIARPPDIFSSAADAEYFEWFQLRTAEKLPGSYQSDFWQTLVFQTSMSEPAVRHASLALACFHKKAIHPSGSDAGACVASDGRQDHLILQHSLRAIDHLQRHFKAKDQTSYRIALVSCILFASLDLLRGHIQQSRIHLANGLKILLEMQLLHRADDGVLYARRCQGGTDMVLFEAHARLSFQFQLFRPSTGHPTSFQAWQGDAVASPPPRNPFFSLRGAWTTLEWHIQNALRTSELTRSCCPTAVESSFARMANRQREQQQHSLADLRVWLDHWETFRGRHLGSSCREQRANWLLRCFHLMATIMTETCLSRDESVYDQHTDKFISLAIHLIKLRQVALADEPWRIPSPSQPVEISKSVIDVGAIQPLYYLATKCRVHRLRLQAIRLLEASAHREGIWESRTAGLVARKVMELEESEFSAGEHAENDFPILEYPVSPAVLSLPLPPVNHRLRQTDVELLGEPTDRVVLRYTRDGADGDREPLVSTYNVHSRRWGDSTHVTEAMVV